MSFTNHPCLLLVDLQKGFLEPRWGRRNNLSLEKNVENLLAIFRRKMWKVVHVRHDSQEPDSPLRRGGSGFDFLPCAIPLPGEEIFTKRVHSAFIGTALERFLHGKHIRELVLAGLTTDHCVSTTMRMAFDLGFDPTLIADAAATFGREIPGGKQVEAETVHQIALASLDREFGKVSSLSRFSNSVRPHFTEFSHPEISTNPVQKAKNSL